MERNVTLEIQSVSRVLLKSNDETDISSQLDEVKVTLDRVKNDLAPYILSECKDDRERQYKSLGLVLFKAATTFGWKMYFDLFSYYFLTPIAEDTWGCRLSLVSSFLQLPDLTMLQLEYVMSLLKELLNSADFKVKQDQLVSCIIHDIMSIPSVVHNRFHALRSKDYQTPSVSKNKSLEYFAPKKYFKSVSKTFLKTALGDNSITRTTVGFNTLFIDKIVKTGQSLVFCKVWYDKYLSRNDDDDIKNNSIKLFTKCVSESALESIIWSLLTSTSAAAHNNTTTTKSVLVLFSARINEKRMQSLITHRIILRNALKACMLDCIPPCAAVFEKVVQVWAMKSFTTSFDTEMIVSISSYIKLNLSATSTGSNTQPMLVKGISQFLDSDNVKIRAVGMKIATELSKIIDPDNPLSFDDKEGEDKEPESEEGIKASSKESLVVRKNTGKKKKVVDPDEVFVLLSSEEEDGDDDDDNSVQDAGSSSSSEDDDDLQPFDCQEEDSSTIVMYIHDCLAVLNAKDDDKEDVSKKEERVCSALKTIKVYFDEKSSAANADDDHYVIPLTRAVLRNEIAVKKYKELLDASVLSMAMATPRIILPFFVSSYVFDKEILYPTRIDCFDYIRQTIAAISNVRVESTRSLRYRPAKIINEFAKSNIAVKVFGLLLKGTVSICVASSNSNSSSFDDMILANALHTLGCIIEYTTGTLVVHSLTSKLLPLIWSLYELQVIAAVVRRQLLFCFARILMAENETKSETEEYAGIVEKFIKAIIKSSTMDSDVQVRSMCRNLLNSITT